MHDKSEKKRIQDLENMSTFSKINFRFFLKYEYVIFDMSTYMKTVLTPAT